MYLSYLTYHLYLGLVIYVMTFVFTFFIIIRRRAIIECALVSIFFFIIPSKPGSFQGLQVYYYCPFSCETETEAAEAILVLSILINRSYFQLIAFKSGVYRFTASAKG